MMDTFLYRTRVAAASLVASAILLTGCSNSAVSTISSAVASTTTQTLLTDAPSDQIIALGLTINSIVLTDAAGKTATVLSTPVTVELSHLDAMQEPLLPPLKIPQDTYVSATINVSAPTVVYVDPSTGKPVMVAATLASATTTVTFASPITVTATSAPICFDLLVGQSVSFAGSTVTVTPTFNVTQIPLSQQPTNGSNGRVNGILGKVVSVSGTSLVITGPNGQSITVVTNSSTVLQGFTSLAGLTAGELVNIDIAHQTDGSLLAVRISLAATATQSLLVGPIASVTGTTSFTQVVRQAVGVSVTSSASATTYTVNLSSGTTFGLAPQAGTLPSLPFTALFSAATLKAGQNVAVIASAVSGTTATAASVTLAPQTVGGTIASITTSGGFTAYTVTLPTASALASASGATSVVVYANSSTQSMNSAVLAVGSSVRFNGLLFNDGGTLRMVAGACNDMPGAAPPQKHL